MVGFAPAGKVIFIEAFAGFAEVGDDFGIGDAIKEHLVEAVADVLWQASDLSGAAAEEDEACTMVEGLGLQRLRFTPAGGEEFGLQGGAGGLRVVRHWDSCAFVS